ncbi:MAG: energy-coupling factor transporter transmembrane protein EcfT [Synergistaceae bacterium]|jgi:energy-coupling factor transport system permease protein|nr:energy-coupling factor transporter transmembrane protein EcfT [Synergistaceae bacterium]
MKGFLDYVDGNSVLHRLNPMTKLIISFGLCASCFLTQNHAVVAAIALFDLCLGALAGISRRSALIFISLLKLSAALFLLQVFFVRQGNILLVLPFGLRVTDAGVSFSALFALRLAAVTMPLSLMLSITRMSDIANVLVRYLGIPYKYAFVLTTAMRFIPLFTEEMAGIMEAQTARGVRFDTGNFFRKVRLLLPLCVPLLISSVRRIEVSAISAELRGFNLRGRSSGYKRYSFGANDAAALFICVMIIVASAMI